MARTIDRVIDYIRGLDSAGGLSPTMKRVLIDRIDAPVTPAEIDRAKAAIAADGESGRLPGAVTTIDLTSLAIEQRAQQDALLAALLRRFLVRDGNRVGHNGPVSDLVLDLAGVVAVRQDEYTTVLEVLAHG